MGDIERQLNHSDRSATSAAAGAGADAGTTVGTGAAVNAGADAGTTVGNAPGQYGTSSLYTDVMGSGPGFKFDKATLQELADDWNSAANKFKDFQLQAQYIASAQPPGNDFASGGHSESVQRSGHALLDTLMAREQYCRAMHDKFRQALGKYAAAEDTAVDAVNKTGGSL